MRCLMFSDNIAIMSKYFQNITRLCSLLILLCATDICHFLLIFWTMGKTLFFFRDDTAQASVFFLVEQSKLQIELQHECMITITISTKNLKEKKIKKSPLLNPKFGFIVAILRLAFPLHNYCLSGLDVRSTFSQEAEDWAT